jgi:hypothetical protein
VNFAGSGYRTVPIIRVFSFFKVKCELPGAGRDYPRDHELLRN